MRMRIKRDIGKGQLCTRRGMWGGGSGGGGGGVWGVLLRILGGDVPHGYLYPDPISDQNMSFAIRFYALVVPLKTIPGE